MSDYEFNRMLDELLGDRETAARRSGDDSPSIPKKRLTLEPPIVSSRGKSFDLTNEQIYELLELS